MTANSHTFHADTREVEGKQVRSLRREGLLPAVLYGNHKEARSLMVSAHDFHKLYEEAGTTSLINLTIDKSKATKVLIHDVQLHPTRRNALHVDFFEVNMKEKLRTEVPVELTGTADAVEVEGGTLVIVKDTVEVECLPDDLVQELTIDISSLKTFEDVIRISDLVVPAGITLLEEAEDILVSVAEPRSEEEMAELDEAVVDTAGTVESEKGSGTDTEEAAPEEK